MVLTTENKTNSTNISTNEKNKNILHHTTYDKRFLRTEKAFQDALLQLAERFDINDITIIQIVNEAGYSRNAFYSHFSGKEQLIDKLFRYHAEMIRKILKWDYHILVSDSASAERARFDCDLNFFMHVYDNQKFFQLLITDKLISNGVDYLCEIYFELYLADAEYIDQIGENGRIATNNVELISYTSMYSYLAMVKWWNNNNFKYSPTYMADQKAIMRNQFKV